MPAPPQKSPERPATARGTGSWLPLLGVLIGLWAIIPPYVKTFGDLGVTNRVEVADHVIPGIAVIVVSLLGYLLLRSADPSELALFVGGAIVTLAGFWMVATHVGLISQARDDVVPVKAVVWHGLPGLVVTALGVVWTIRFWEAEADEAASGR